MFSKWQERLYEQPFTIERIFVLITITAKRLPNDMLHYANIAVSAQY